MRNRICAHLANLFAAFIAIFFHTFCAIATAGPNPPPRLILFISVDQMRYDYFTRFDKLFSSGFQTLIKNGALFSEARFRHAATETGPGHSVLLSGKHPSHTGIIANEWYDISSNSWMNVVDDKNMRPIGAKGRAASPQNFIGETFGDALKAKYPRAMVVGVSAKDRAAVLLAGKSANGAFWTNKSGKFMTSSYYMQSLPKWAKDFNARSFLERFTGQTWTRLRDESLYNDFAGPDAGLGESDGNNIVFPHAIFSGDNDEDIYDNFSRSPFLDELTLDFALKARQAFNLGEDDIPDILAISFSATDKIGHVYGPDSHEILDQLLRLDQTIGRLLSEIDKAIGLSKTLVVLSADHGVLPIVEQLQARHFPARRVHPDEIRATLDRIGKSFPRQTGHGSGF